MAHASKDLGGLVYECFFEVSNQPLGTVKLVSMCGSLWTNNRVRYVSL